MTPTVKIVGNKLRIEIPIEVLTLEAKKTHGDLRIDHLSFRQRQVLNGLLAGKFNKEVASDLGISERTVKAHLQNIYGILGMRRRELLVRFGLCEDYPQRPLDISRKTA